MKLTDQQLAELQALADAATPGPWWSGECVPADGHALAWLGNIFVDCDGGKKNYAAPSSDAEFIAAAREAIPALLADLKDAERKIALCIQSRDEEIAELESELASTRQQLAEAQLKLDERNSKIFDLCGDIHPDEFPELDAAIATAVEPHKRDAERYQALRRGQHWSVINGIGDILRADELDASIDALSAKGSA